MTRYELIALMAAQIESGMQARSGGDACCGYSDAGILASIVINHAVEILDQIAEFEPESFSG